MFLSDVCLSDVCLSVAYSRPKSRTERPRKTKIDTKVAHVTRNSDATFKVKRSKVKVTRPVYSPRRLCTGSCSGQCGNVLSAGNGCYVAVCRRGRRLSGSRSYGAHRGKERGGGTSCRHALSLLQNNLIELRYWHQIHCISLRNFIDGFHTHIKQILYLTHFNAIFPINLSTK